MSIINDQINARTVLVNSLTRRVPTFAVADAIVKLGVVGAGTQLGKELAQLASSSRWSYEMNNDFDKVVPVEGQLDVFVSLFPGVHGDTKIDLGDPYAPGYVKFYRELIQGGLSYLGVSGFNSAGEAYKNRYGLGFTVGEAGSKKAFTKKLRYLAFFEDKVNRVEDTLNLRHAQMQAKSRLAYRVDGSKVDDITLAYIAYVAARANRRSLFMLGGQSKAFDTITTGLFELLPDDAAWEQVAYVSPTTNVFTRLSSEKLGELVGVFHKEMVASANALGSLWSSLPARMRKEMVMVKGVDSSRWNAYAGAFNTMRSAWISASLAAGLGDVLNVYLPGKAPRLMAADVVWWAREMGQDLHEDTVLFDALPYPWLVVSGEAELTRTKIVDKISELKVEKALDSGWVGPRARVEDEVAKAEPATVHGVVIGDATLAPVLRKYGAFSGKDKNVGAVIASALVSVLSREIVEDDEKVYPVVG